MSKACEREAIAERLQKRQEHKGGEGATATATAVAARDAASVRLVAVSKTKPLQMLLDCYHQVQPSI